MKRLVLATLLLTFVLVGARDASASTITYNSLVGGGTGWFQGSGNPDGGFTLVSSNNIDIALRAKYRQSPTVISSPTNVYSVVAGPQTAATSGGPIALNRAAWSYEMGINFCSSGGPCGVVLNDFLGSTWIQVEDLTAGLSSGPMSFFQAYAFDHNLYGPTGEVTESAATLLTSWAAQNSENGVFANFGIPFDMNAAHYYRISMWVDNPLGGQLAYNSIDISVGGATPVPEPASLVLLGSGLLGVVTMVRRRKAKA